MLKQLMLSRKIEQRKATIAELIEQENDFKTREAELGIALDEANTDEEIGVVEESVNALDTDKAEVAEKKNKLESEIKALEDELEEMSKKEPKNDEREILEKEPQERGEKMIGKNHSNRIQELVAREDVKDFLIRTREMIGQKRTVTGADLLIPDVMLGMLRDNIANFSKLITKVNYKPLKGKARQNVNGTIPEAVWTEMVGALNELEISFNQVEVDGYKVGGFVAIPNSILQDSDINLAQEILTQISKAIAIALDRAILYGTGVKQPLGIVPRLAQTVKPGGYPVNAPAWADLHTSNVTKVNTTGAALIGSIITAFGACNNNFSDGRKFFAMNTLTYTYLLSTLLNFNAAGALATGMGNQMPILGGDIVILDFLASYDIVGGYGDLYLLAEREGTFLAASEHVKFIEDMTVFKGLARYDGLPVIAEGFFVINIKNTDAATSQVFEFDYANTGLGALTLAAATGTNVGDTKITITGGEASGTTFGYAVGNAIAPVKTGDTLVKLGNDWGAVVVTSGVAADITAAAGKIVTMAEFDAKGKAIKAGAVISIPATT